MKRRRLPWSIVVPVCSILAFASGNAQEPSSKLPGVAIVGKAGDRVISEEEFVRRFELSPGLQRGKKGTLHEQKLVALNSLVAEKLLAQEAESRGIPGDSAVTEGLEGIRRMLARDELYRVEVAGKVTVNEKEVAEGLRRSVREVFVQYLYCAREEDARFIAGQLTKGSDLSGLAFDSSMAVARDTVTVAWGEADPALEEAAFTVKPGQVSGVVRAKNGFYIVAPLRTEPNPHYAGMEPAVRRERVMLTLRLRKESARLDEYMGGVLRDKAGYAKGKEVRRLALAFSGVLVRSPGDSLYELPADARERLLRDLQPALTDTFMVAGSVCWTVRDVVRRFLEAGFRVPSPQPLLVAGMINAQSRIWVQQELLEQEAIRRGLDRNPGVQRQLQEWKDSYLAQVMRARLESDVTVTDAQVYQFLEMNKLPARVPEVRIRELRMKSLDDAQEPLKELSSGAPFAEVVRRWSIDPRGRARGGLSDFFRITERPPVGEIASEMKPGDVAGPILERDTFLVFQLVERREEKSADSAARMTFRSTKKELTGLLRKQTLDRFVAESAARRGVVLYDDRLAALQVSPVPMIAFRVIGFGGRMFAAPLLIPLFDWTRVRPTDQPLLP